MNRKLCRNKKGVSTVISTIIMIMVVMVGMSVLFGALIVYSDNFHSGIGSSVLESITVEDVHFINSNTVQLSIYNTGKIGIDISNIYIEGQMATLKLTPPAKTIPIAEGMHYDGLTVTAPPGTFSSGNSYSFKIVTLRGTGFEGTYIW
jgi:hypothetical protein